MLDVLAQTLPFFALIGLGYGAARSGFFGASAAADLTRFVFYFALSAMLFRFAANLSLAEVLNWRLVAAYLAAGVLVWAVAAAVARARGLTRPEMAVEAHVAITGNTGFLGLPMLALLLGEAAIGPVMLVLAVDLIVFGSLVVLLLGPARDGRLSRAFAVAAVQGLVRNPMIVAMAAGLAWSATGWALPGPVQAFLAVLGAAATPCALFAIGASLAQRSAERLRVALWLSGCKLVLHPGAVALFALVLIPVDDPFAAGVAIAAAALPVAGNAFILAQHYGVAPQRVSSSILVSTVLSVLTVTAALALIGQPG